MVLRDIAKHLGGEIEGDATLEIIGLSPIEEAKPGDLTFLANPKYTKFLQTTLASAIILSKDIPCPSGKSAIRVANPYLAFSQAISFFYPPKPSLPVGIHPTAIVGKEVLLGKDVAIGPYVVIGDRCRIGEGTILFPGVILGNDVWIGSHCVIRARVSIREEVRIGDRVIIHDGAVIGSDGFGFAFEAGRYHKIPQVGTVVIEDDVEIGANVTIDRATLGETRICKGVKLDNLIQIAHNCYIGEHTAIAGQAGLSGSTRLGKYVRVGGQAGFAGHLEVGDFAVVGAQSGVDKSVPPHVMVFGYPARPHREALRFEASVHQIPQALKLLRELRNRIENLEKEWKTYAEKSKDH